MGGTLDAITGYNTKFEFLDETTAGALEFSSKGLTILSALGSYSELRADGFGYTRSIAGGGVGAALGLGEMSILSPIITPLGAAGITAAMSVTGANSYLVKQTVTFDRAAEKLPPRGGIPLAIIPF